ncbi:MAG: hydrogenase [Phycisphaerae bacterium]|nr:hydrogenase [Phycisphaerae bacterium]
MNGSILSIGNGQRFEVGRCPVVPMTEFSQTVQGQIGSGAHLAALLVRPAVSDRALLTAVWVIPEAGRLGVLATEIGEAYPCLTGAVPEAHMFEREIAEHWGIQPLGHPWLKPGRFEPGKGPRIGEADFFSMQGEEVHEVAVGPVHAGVIEPGHFRFQCHGETVYHLEISLGYQHRGVERALVGGPYPRTIHLVETLAGDTTIGHTTAFARAVEALSGTPVPGRAEAIRGIAAELERIANHVGDLGALAGDVGFLPTMSYCGRIRGDVLNATALICGNRFGRGLVRPGGVAYDLDDRMAGELKDRLRDIERDVRSAVELMFDAPSVLARLEGTGTVSRETAAQIGLVGLAARASGLDRDIRQESPYGIYRLTHLPICTWDTGDCFARAYVRWLEVQQSLEFVGEQLDALPDGPIAAQARPILPNQVVVSLTEGWRGEICHVVQTDDRGRFAVVKVVDPSFHNWFGLAMALRDQQISDFPLCNKSFNLSYCGQDL